MRGTKIGAAGSGKARIGYIGGYGVADGATVKSGAFIGNTGISGNVVTGGDPRLHFEIIVKGNNINSSSVFTWGNQ